MKVEWWRFEIYNKNEDLVKTLDKAMTEDEAAFDAICQKENETEG